MPRISVHLYDLRSDSRRDLAVLLQRISHTQKPARWRDLGGKDVALLDVRQSRRERVWLLDFVKRRHVGPGRLRADSEIESFELQRGEGFGEETAALIDLDRGWMAAEWNLHGVRPQAMVEYINLYEHDPECDWVATAKLDPEVDARLARMSHLRVAEIKVRMSPQVSREMRQHGAGLGDALAQASDSSNAATLAVELSMSRQPGFLRRGVGALCRRLAALDDPDVKIVKIKAREGDVGRDECIDLLEERVVAKYSSDDLEVHGSRYTQDSRWRALLRLHAGWRQQL